MKSLCKSLLILALAAYMLPAPVQAQKESTRGESPRSPAQPLPAAEIHAAGTISSPSPSRSLSLRSCFERAELYNREIVSAKWTLPIARAGLRIAAAVPNPIFQLQAGFGPSFNEVYTGQTQQFGWTQQLQTAAKRSKKIDLAKAGYVLQELQLNALRFDVHNRVRQAYAEQAAAEAYAQLVESERSVAAKLYKIAERLFTAGKVAQTEVMQAKLIVSQFDTQRNEAQIRLQHATAGLQLLIGEVPDHIEIIDVDDNGLFKLSAQISDIVPSPEKELPDLAQLQLKAQEFRPDLKAARQQLNVCRKALTLARAQQIPDLFVGSGYTFMTEKKNEPVGLIYAPDWLGGGVFLNLTTEAPVFYQHQGEVKLAAANLRTAEKQVDLLQCQIGADLVTAYNQVVVARANIFAFQQNLLPTASQVAALARRGYEVGKSDLSTAIVAQQQYQQLLSAYFDSVVAYQTAWSDLERATGIPLR